MRNNRSYTQQVHHHNSTTTTTTSKTYFFFPMLCRLSLNDVVSKPTKLTDLSSSSSSSSPDPSSPKISSIGQIKRRSTSNYHHHTAGTITGNKSANYTKLRKLFSSKYLISPPIEAATISRNRNRNRICNGDVTKLIDSNSKKIKHNAVISIEDLDPPLPVVKTISRTDDKLNVNLGKRRGIDLKILQIQPFQLSAVHS